MRLQNRNQLMSTTTSSLNIICLESDAFYSLVDEVINRIKAEQGIEINRWIDEHEAMKLLRISSKTTLQKYRDERRIGYSQPSRKVIVYDRNSILNYLEKSSKKPIQ